MPELSDEAIARRALADKNEFATLVERYGEKLSRYLARLGIALKEDREDVLQNAFIKAYRNLNSFDPTLSFSSWMYRITHNEAMSFFRARQARPQVVLDEEGQAGFAELEDESADTAAFSDLRLRKEELERALATLSPAERDVLALRFFEDRSYAEISDILQVPIGTVSTLLYRAKRSLKNTLAKTT